LYPLVITLQDWSVNHVRNLKCQPCMEAAQLVLSISEVIIAKYYIRSTISIHLRMQFRQRNHHHVLSGSLSMI
ncbi:MAG: hypothetical protein WA323_17490, partial [Candidatus Nitrosopolaris sp.]